MDFQQRVKTLRANRWSLDFKGSSSYEQNINSEYESDKPSSESSLTLTSKEVRSPKGEILLSVLWKKKDGVNDTIWGLPATMVGVFEKISGIFSCTVNLEDLFQPQSDDLALQAKVWFSLYWSHRSFPAQAGNHFNRWVHIQRLR